MCLRSAASSSGMSTYASADEIEREREREIEVSCAKFFHTKEEATHTRGCFCSRKESIVDSVTRFGEISPLRQNFNSLWATFGMVNLVFDKLL